MKKSVILAFILLLAIGTIGALASLKGKVVTKENEATPIKENTITATGDTKSDTAATESDTANETVVSTGATSSTEFSCDNVLKYPNISAYTGANFSIGDTGSTAGRLVLNYYKIKELYIDTKTIKNSYDYEYNTIKEMSDANSDCSGILSYDKNDTYTYDICKLYKTKDIQKVDAFKFDAGDEKMKDLLKSLILGKILPGVNESQYNYIVSFEDFKKDVTFDFQSAPTEFLMNYVIYLKTNGDGAFLGKLNMSFIGECKQLAKN